MCFLHIFQHIDVFVYYLRKKGKYGSVDASFKFTTTACWFNCLIQAMYKQFLAKNKDVNLITQEDPIAEYMMGYFMRDCGIFAAVFAEYLIQGIEIPKHLDDIDALRSRYRILLLDYGKKKQSRNAVSDDESTGRLKHGVI
ncbi:uncharacterized protein LOC132645085 [Lycium barbarum]|uniref:uncharacterized protein LOC132645085 n=1 Tax=Lycium barbarum TaxID=112863 RepID=UPI00293F3A8C|nr:uncharacterized protein LOC132645085 [Lycium barbarum]